MWNPLNLEALLNRTFGSDLKRVTHELTCHRDENVRRYIQIVCEIHNSAQTNPDYLSLARSSYKLYTLVKKNPDLPVTLIATEFCQKVPIPSIALSAQRSLLDSAQYILKISPDHPYSPNDLELFIDILIEAAQDRDTHAHTLQARAEQHRQYQYINSYLKRAIILLAQKQTHDPRFPQVVARFYESRALINGRTVDRRVIEFLNTLTPTDPRWEKAIEHMRHLSTRVTNGDHRLLNRSWIAIRNLQKNAPPTVESVVPHETTPDTKVKKKKRKPKKKRKKNVHTFFQREDPIVTSLREQIKCTNIHIAQLTLPTEVENYLREHTATCIMPINLETHCSLLYICSNPKRICYLDALETDVPQHVRRAIREVYHNFDLANITRSPITIPPEHAAANTELIIFLMGRYISQNYTLVSGDIFIEVKYHDILEALGLATDACYDTLHI